MLKKKDFIRLMTEFKSLNDSLDNLNDAFSDLDKDFGGLRLGRVVALLLDVLQSTMEDKENNWIELFIYEMDWGKNYKTGCITDNGKNIPLKTFEDLYNILTKK